MKQRKSVLEIAKSQIGVCEPTGDDKFIRWYNSVDPDIDFGMGVPWCAIFVSWVLRAAEVPEEICPTFASCTTAVNWAKRKKVWYSRLTGHTPQPGELVFFDWGNDGVQDHVGFVKSVTTNSITTIEGNTKAGTDADGVHEKTYSIKSKYILGYIDVQYQEDSPVKPVELTPVQNIQKMLNDTYGAKLDVDGIWGPKSNKAMIVAVQTLINKRVKAKIDVDGIWGAESKRSFGTYANKNTGDMVKLIQCMLVVHGSSIDMDGIFGNKTLAAVKTFQKKSGLSPDGIVGKDTMTKLLK